MSQRELDEDTDMAISSYASRPPVGHSQQLPSFREVRTIQPDQKRLQQSKLTNNLYSSCQLTSTTKSTHQLTTMRATNHRSAQAQVTKWPTLAPCPPIPHPLKHPTTATMNTQPEEKATGPCAWRVPREAPAPSSHQSATWA